MEYATGNAARRAIQELSETKLDGRTIFVRRDDKKEDGSRSRSRSRSPYSRRSPPRRRSPSPPTQHEKKKGSIDHLLRRDRPKATEDEDEHKKGTNGKEKRKSVSRSRSRSKEKKVTTITLRKKASTSRSPGSSGRDVRSRDRGQDKGREKESVRKNYKIIIENLSNDMKLHLLTDAFKDFGNIVNSSLEYDDNVSLSPFGVPIPI